MTARTPKYETIYEGKKKEHHRCDKPEWNAELGEIVRLPCGHYWHMCWQDAGDYISPYWGRVRFWNIVALWRICRS